MHKYYVSVFFILVVIYALYSKEIYTEKTNFGHIKLSSNAVKGENLWLQNNCNACHQLYGLGGYMGPDLTNVSSHPQKSAEYLKVMMISGVKSMPKFNFSSDEQEYILQFLKEVDRTGYYPNRNAQIKYTGWVQYQKKENNEK
ncbi:cytochrome c [Chryseobacterium sp. Ch-15]|uniref:Cytochrome c n=1 Tax=Chryseobacterium muglaense TaxID=2893752 RepID=A0A9Q3UQ84_9FLAO|nr:cytochrome c [Chryseobacterium muglaense]MBD3906341.1 cytochrome c [Chryseobacterium muglaense]MCC9033109.1 cytochrome c [Chryseobacterium muglaense]MCM2556040.1 cytochrome c [Chryseobacterium muglaense]